MRRVLRECFRIEQHAIPSVDLVIRVQKKFDKKDFVQLQQEFNQVIGKLKLRINISATVQSTAKSVISETLT